MWCKQCRQDVPGSATAVVGQFVCPRCSQALLAESAETYLSAGARAPSDHGKQELELEAPPRPLDPPLDPDDFDWDQNLKTLRALTAEIAPSLGKRVAEVDGRVAAPSERLLAAAATQNARAQPAASLGSRRSVGGILTWLIIWSSVTAFVGGGLLFGWALRTDRGDAGTQGAIIAGGGLAGLFIGLLLQLERIWHASRHTLDRLDAIDARLAQVEESTALHALRHNSPSQAFYGHFADGAAPQVLLADLKGQLDLLALKFASRRAA